MIKKVMLDMDGVICDFLGGLHKFLRVPYQYDSYPYKLGLWNMLTDIKGFGDTPVTFEQCNDACTMRFWRDLEWMPDGHDIFRYVLNYFSPKQVYLLTTPMPNPGSYTGKALWVEQNLPLYKKRLIVTQAPKSLLAGPDTLLIDDKDQNVREFEDAGGAAILVPRPWNHMYADQDRSANIVKIALDTLAILGEIQ